MYRIVWSWYNQVYNWERLLYRCPLLLILVVFIMASIGVSCSRLQRQAQILSDAERIAYEYPDSALSMLDIIEPFDLSVDSLKAQYYLIKASINDNLGHLRLSDSLIRYSADYYKDKDKDINRAVRSATLSALYDYWVSGNRNSIKQLDSLANLTNLPDSIAIFPLRKRVYWSTKIFDEKGNRPIIKRLISIDEDSTSQQLYKFWLYTDYLFEGQNDSSLIVLNELIDQAVHAKSSTKQFSYEYEKIGTLEELGYFAECLELADKFLEKASGKSIEHYIHLWKSLALFNLGNRNLAIQAPKVIRKADMDVYHPSKSAVENSQNGIQLLNYLMIPTLTISDVLGTIQAAGQSVQVRINGKEVSIDQVRALLPETIKRVEWIDNPSLRYGGVNYVLNFIVANLTVGGSLMTTARPALNVAWGFYMANAKFNVGRSQWEVGGNYKLTNKIKTHRDNTETFTFLDGSLLTRNEVSRGGSLDNSQAHAWASYSYVKPDTTVFMTDFILNQNVTDKYLYNGLLSLSDNSDDILLTDSHGNTGGTPLLSLYWQQNFAHKQVLIVNFNSSFYFGRSFSDYIEQIPDASNSLTDIHTNIKDRNQAYAVEANYIRNWKNGRFTAGTTYTANRNRSSYENLGGDLFQRQDKVCCFGGRNESTIMDII